MFWRKKEKTAATYFYDTVKTEVFNGDKYWGSFGDTIVYTADYYTLRLRSAQLFEDNVYGRGFIRRLVTNIVGTGLSLETLVDHIVLGLSPEDPTLEKWSDITEARFDKWMNNPQLCDFYGELTFGQLLEEAMREAIIGGDVLVICHLVNGLPRVQLVPARFVLTPPLGNMDKDIRDGVEYDANGKIIAYWVQQRNGTIERIAARGSKSSRRIAWLYTYTDKRLGQVRGVPLLGLLVSSLKEMDTYVASVQRKATVGSYISTYIKRTLDTLSTRPITAGAAKRGTVTQTDDAGVPVRTVEISKNIPGMVLQSLAPGEEPVTMNANTADLNFSGFQAAVINSLAQCLEIPPEIAWLSFNANYSASAAAINEFNATIAVKRNRMGCGLCQPVYEEWLISETLAGRISDLGLLSAWRDERLYAEYTAWVSADWIGGLKPTTDRLKQAKAYVELINAGLMTRRTAARELGGGKYSQIIKILKTENQLLAEANQYGENNNSTNQ